MEIQWKAEMEALTEESVASLHEVKIGDEIDYTKMCSGSEMRGIRDERNDLHCGKCDQIVPAFSKTYNLVPVHEEPEERK